MFDKINHTFSINRIFCNLEGGYGGPPPGKILKTKKAGEAISGHFLRTILPLNEQFQRILLLFIVCIFLSIKFRQICILSVLVFGCT